MIITRAYQQPTGWAKELVWKKNGETFYPQEGTGSLGIVFHKFYSEDEDVPNAVLEAAKDKDIFVTFLEYYDVDALDDLESIALTWDDAPFYLTCSGVPKWGLLEDMSVIEAIKDCHHTTCIGEFVIGLL